MLDVNLVIEGKFEPKDMPEALEASVLVEEMAGRVEKGRSNVFGYVLLRGRTIFMQMKEEAEKGGWNEATPWYKVASELFAQEAEQALTAGEIRGYTKKQTQTFANAVRSVRTAMANNAALDERDPGSGAFVLSGKTAIEQANKAHKEAAEAEERAASAEALKRQGLGPRAAGKAEVNGSGEPAETGSEFADPACQALFEKVVVKLHELYSQDGSVKNPKTGKLETGPERVERLLGSTLSFAGTLISDFEAVKLAALDDSNESKKASNG